MSDKLQEAIKFWMAVIMLIGGMVISFISLYLPPKGVIDSSVLMLIGEVFVFVGAIWHLYNYTNLQIRRLDNQAKNNNTN